MIYVEMRILMYASERLGESLEVEHVRRTLFSASRTMFTREVLCSKQDEERGELMRKLKSRRPSAQVDPLVQAVFSAAARTGRKSGISFYTGNAAATLGTLATLQQKQQQRQTFVDISGEHWQQAPVARRAQEHRTGN